MAQSQRTAISGESVETLKRMKDLRYLDISDSKISEWEAVTLRVGLPACEIRYGDRHEASQLFSGQHTFYAGGPLPPTGATTLTKPDDSVQSIAADALKYAHRTQPSSSPSDQETSDAVKRLKEHNPDLPDQPPPWQRIEMPSALLRQPQDTLQPLADTRLGLRGNVTSGFVADMARYEQALPSGVVDLLQRAGIYVVAGR